MHRQIVIDSLLKDKIVDLSKPKEFADDKLNLAQKLRFVFETVEKIVVRGENTVYQHFFFSFSPPCFQKPSSSGSLNSGLLGIIRLTISQKPKFRLCQTDSLWATILHLMKMAEFFPVR